MLINDDTQISKNTLDYKIMNVNKIDCISRDHRNNENDIESDVEHRLYKRFYNKLINLKQVFKSDIIFSINIKRALVFIKINYDLNSHMLYCLKKRSI